MYVEPEEAFFAKTKLFYLGFRHHNARPISCRRRRLHLLLAEDGDTMCNVSDR